METEDHVPKAEHIDPITACLIRDDLHMRAHLRSKGHLLTPALKEIRRTRAKSLLQWHAENGHENVLFTNKKIFTIEEQYNNQYNKIIINKNLKLLLINYLARKVDVLFHFPSRSQNLCNRTYGKTVCVCVCACASARVYIYLYNDKQHIRLDAHKICFSGLVFYQK
jgi:hypothetical protein